MRIVLKRLWDSRACVYLALRRASVAELAVREPRQAEREKLALGTGRKFLTAGVGGATLRDLAGQGMLRRTTSSWNRACVPAFEPCNGPRLAVGRSGYADAS